MVTIDEEQVERLLVNSSENLKEFQKLVINSNIDYTSLKFFPYEGKQLHDRSKINLLRWTIVHFKLLSEIS